jgi:protein SCO1
MFSLSPRTVWHWAFPAAVLLALLSLLLTQPVGATGHAPDPLTDIRFEQRLGERLPLDVPLRDEQGRDVRLGSYFGSRPVILVPGYFRCRTLCPVTRDSLLAVVDQLGLALGRDFLVVSYSIDPREGPADALALQEEYSAQFSGSGFAEGWRFVTGPQDSISQISAAIGYEPVYDEVTDQYSHVAGVVVVTPEGRVARYFYGIEYQAFDLRLGLVEAAENRIGTLVDQILLSCYRYDPVGARYTPVIMTVMRIAFVVTTLTIFGGVFWMMRHYNPPPSMPGPA